MSVNDSANAATKVLVRGVNWLGDAVMTTPALQRLRERYSSAVITLLVPEKIQDLFLHHPAINEVLPFAKSESVFAVGRKVREKAFDLALVLPNSPRSALEPWLGRVPARVGLARPWRKWLLTRTVPERAVHARMHKRTDREVLDLVKRGACERETYDSRAHQVFDYLYLVSDLGASSEPVAPFLVVSDGEKTLAARKFGFDAPGPKPSARGPLILGLNPGAEYGPAKRWPVENFAAVARELIRLRSDVRVMVFGGPGDAKTGEILDRLTNGKVINLVGKTSVRELMVLLSLCHVVLTNDTGPMHVAAALGAPVIVPFGSTEPTLTGPGLPGEFRHVLLKGNAPCAPCFRRTCPIDLRCLTSITVDQVVDALRTFSASSI